MRTLSTTSESDAMATSSPRTRVIVWFRNDLRLLDNAVVARAAALRGQSDAAEVVPVYVFDETFFKTSKRGLARFGAGRGKFTIECVDDLKRALRGVGSDLLVRCGKTEDVITELTLTGANDKTIVLTQTEVTSEETDMDRAVERASKERARSGGASASVGVDTLPRRRPPVRLRRRSTRFTRCVHAISEQGRVKVLSASGSARADGERSGKRTGVRGGVGLDA